MQRLLPHADAQLPELLPAVKFPDSVHEHLPQDWLYGKVQLSEPAAADGVTLNAAIIAIHASAVSIETKNILNIFMALSISHIDLNMH
ncbi:MAG: hypothetical protein ACYDHZ_07860 [Dehalococcoidia bacterium]